jgi:hypothetical protein
MGNKMFDKEENVAKLFAAIKQLHFDLSSGKKILLTTYMNSWFTQNSSLSAVIMKICVEGAQKNEDRSWKPSLPPSMDLVNQIIQEYYDYITHYNKQAIARKEVRNSETGPEAQTASQSTTKAPKLQGILKSKKISARDKKPNKKRHLLLEVDELNNQKVKPTKEGKKIAEEIHLAPDIFQSSIKLCNFFLKYIPPSKIRVFLTELSTIVTLKPMQ